MNIAITGAGGFIGMELLAVLNKRNDVTVTALTRDASSREGASRSGPAPDHADTADSDGNRDRLVWLSTDYSVESLTAIFKGCRGTCETAAGADESASSPASSDGSAPVPVDAVIHLAGVRGTENDPEKFAVNAAMTENILRAMKAAGTKRIVFASTMSVYNDDSLMPWTEDAPLRGRSCYGDSKADCEDLIRRYAGESGCDRLYAAQSAKEEEAAFDPGQRNDDPSRFQQRNEDPVSDDTDTPITYGIARIAQVLGEGEKRRGMMNVFIDTAREHGTLKVMGKSVNRKQYIYVKDLANVLTVLACGNERFSCSENIVVNVGMPEAYTNLEVAETVNRVFGNPAPIDYDDSYPEKGRPFHMDISRLKDRLGYEPLDMEAALLQFRASRQ